MKNFYIYILLFTLSFSYAQENKYSYVYNYISSKNGLSHNYVSKVVSDSLNVKWIATENGITKYDGLNYYTIRPGLKYPELKNENIETLFIDSKNNLWIGTKSGGVSKLEIKTHTLTNYNSVLAVNNKNSYRIKAFEEDSKGHIWIVTHDNGIYVIDPTKRKKIRHLNNVLSRFIKKDRAGNIWFSERFKLKKYIPETEQLITYNIGEFVSQIVEDPSRNCLWIGLVNKEKKHHILKFDLSTEKISSYPTKIPSHFTSTLYLDKYHNLWVGTWGNGLYISNADLSSFEKMNLVYPPDTKKLNNYEIILDIHKDEHNVIWISSDFGGIVTLTESKGFQNLDQVAKAPILQNEMNFHAIFQHDNDVFLGTLRNGLFYGKDLASLKQLKETEQNKIQAISKHNNNILVAQNNAVLFLNKSKTVTNSLKIPQATCFLTQNNNTLWIGSQQSGLYKVNTTSQLPEIVKTFTNKDAKAKIESMRITSFVEDSDENLWLGTYNGLHLYDKSTDTFKHHTELLDAEIPTIINTIYTDTEFIWLGTPSGLYKLNYEQDKLQILQIYNSLHFGLENDFICGVTSDNQGYLWLTTSTHLIRFDTYANSFINYGQNDGVYTSIFNLRSLYSNTENSTIFSGGTDNLTFFNPENILHHKTKNQLIFTQLKVNSKKVEAFDKVHNNVILTKDFNYTKSIKLSHKETSFTVGFTDTNFSENTSVNYRYQLVGLDEKWNHIKNQNEVNFVGLPAGAYTLLISSSKDYKNWSQPLKLDISVLYAPWSSPMAYLLYFIIFILGLASFIFIILKQMQLKDKLQKEKELSEAKFTFFTNISHEFRTPLTLILSPLKELIQRNNLSTNITDKLVTMEKNADRLLNLINQLLDFRKAEHGLLKLEVSNGNFVRFSNEVFLYFKEQARIKNIAYTFNSNRKEIVFPFDRNKMEIVLCNLISNALKYSKQNDEISLEITANEKFCEISLKDTGIGMSKKSKSKIFDRFYQIQSTNTSNIIGSGIGLSFTKKIIELHRGNIEVESKLDKGTCFTIQLPLNPNLYQKNAIYKERLNTDLIEGYKKIETPTVQDLKVKSHENTILIVDDNYDIRNYLNQLLKEEYNIIEAKDGVEGVDVATKETPDLILCDIMMPRKDGLDVCSDLKAQVTTSHIPIILLTARSSNMFEIQGLETGADDFITKPFDPQVIKARIASALQNRGKIREYFLNKVRFEPTTTEVEQTDLESVFIKKAIVLVEENLTNEHFDIQTMIDNLHMSQSSLYRKIKSLTGLSITAFIRSIRLKKAAEYILAGNDKLNIIALNVGFNDYKYFRESFKKQFGCLPSAYKTRKNNPLK